MCSTSAILFTLIRSDQADRRQQRDSAYLRKQLYLGTGQLYNISPPYLQNTSQQQEGVTARLRSQHRQPEGAWRPAWNTSEGLRQNGTKSMADRLQGR